ncbi:hypothetical protein ACSSNL_18145 [Thalassobius sp. S69A]|uniref:hypothetical protein n=1 Tax=unclassified Thalassovita TaxID=2619711 RepID=UPI003C7DC21E
MTHQIDILGRPPIMKAVTPKMPEIRPALRCEGRDGRAVVYVPYRCPICNAWHVGTKPKGVR